MVQSLGIGRRPLKTSLLSAADIKANPWLIPVMGPAARLVNKLGGNFRWQHLPVPFEVYADGIDLVIFEEFGSGAAALHLKDQVAERNDLLRDEDYRRRFRKDYDSKYGLRVWHRDFFDAEIVDCPDASVIGKSFGQVGVDRGGLHPVDAFLDLVVEHGTELRWRTTISNHRPEVLKKMAREPGIQMGFSDAGAHLRNMAFYNFGLRLLRHVHDAQPGTPFLTIEQAVHRLTGELADWYRIDAGHLRIGDRADLVVIDPAHLDDSLDDYAEEVEQYGGLSRMVNRNDDTVTACSSPATVCPRRGARRESRNRTHRQLPARQHPNPRDHGDRGRDRFFHRRLATAQETSSVAAGSLRTGRRAPTPRPPPASLPRVGVHGQIFSMTPEPRAVMTTRLVVGSSNLCDDAETPSHTGHFRTLRLRASPRRGTGACCVALKPFAFRLDPPPGRVARPAGRAPPPAGRLAPAWPRGHH